jgi:nitrate/nitrite transport system permease protein
MTLAIDMTTTRSAKLAPILKGIAGGLEKLGFGVLAPLFSLAAGDDPRGEVAKLVERLVIPAGAMVLALLLWGSVAPNIKTSLGAVPGPVAVAEQAVSLWQDHVAEREKAQAFYARQDARNAAILAQNPEARVKTRPYTGKPTYIDQIITSLRTVFAGFLLATVIAVPLGVLCGLSRTINAALTPMIQILKPVSPLAWLPIVTMVVSALYVSDDPAVPKSFVTSAITVTLCSLWPALINTTVGVCSIDPDLINVARVLRLSPWAKVRKLVIPSAMPYIFTGLRLSLGVGWMVLIAAEMLAQNPGLGKFVWDEFQNGSSASLARILVAVFTIGLIGFALDRVMQALQTAVSPQSAR